MPIYIIQSITPDDDGTAHAVVEISMDDATKDLENLCGLDISSADALNAAIQAYMAKQLPVTPTPVQLPDDVAKLIGQEQKVDIATLQGIVDQQVQPGPIPAPMPEPVTEPPVLQQANQQVLELFRG